MASLVLELQHDAVDPSTKLTDLLRKALVLATKLNLKELRQWIEQELRGYQNGDVPAYRRLRGQIKVHNPYHGWQPVIFEDKEMAEMMSSRSVTTSIAQLEDLLQRDEPGGVLHIKLPDSVSVEISQSTLGMPPYQVFDRSQVKGIVEAVRTVLLEWSLRLEADGILGEDLTFTPQEKQRASSVTYNIQNMSGVAGNVTAQTVQVGDYNTIHSELKRLGISQADRNELENLLDQLAKTKGKDKEPLLKRGSEWVLAHVKELGQLAKTLGEFFSSGGGSGQLPPSIIT